MFTTARDHYHSSMMIENEANAPSASDRVTLTAGRPARSPRRGGEREGGAGGGEVVLGEEEGAGQVPAGRWLRASYF